MGGMSTTAHRTLADQLRSWSDERLALLLHERPDLATPAPHDSGQLASRAAARSSVLRALDQLNLLELCVLDALVVVGQTRDDVPLAGVAGEPVAVRAALARLADLALAWESPQGLRALTSVAEALAPGTPGVSGLRPVSPDLARQRDRAAGPRDEQAVGEQLLRRGRRLLGPDAVAGGAGGGGAAGVEDVLQQGAGRRRQRRQAAFDLGRRQRVG